MKDERFTIRLTGEQKEAIFLAAARQGTSVSNWVLKVLLRAAKRAKAKEGGK